MAILNTHAVVKKFTQHGFTEEHAELIVDAINDQNDQLATKNDLAILKTELKTDINELKVELKADITALKTDIYNLELKLESKIEHEISEVKSEIKAINTNIKWIIAIGLLIVGILVKSTFIH
jgi:hypothetical protein